MGLHPSRKLDQRRLHSDCSLATTDIGVLKWCLFAFSSSILLRAEAREEQARINTRFTSTLVIAATIIVAVRLAREDIALPTPRLIFSGRTEH